jgi:hypothetical protein
MIPSSKSIVRLWDMLEINAERFVRTLHVLAVLQTSSSSLVQGKTRDELDAISQQRRIIHPEFRKDLEQMYSDLVEMDMRLSAITLQEIIQSIDYPPAPPGPARFLTYPTYHIAEHAELLNKLGGRIHDEFNGKIFLSLSPKEHDLFTKGANWFDDAILNKFPGTREDLDEAVLCLAMGRYTSGIFHLMRVLESIISALANNLGNVTIMGKDGQFLAWGPLIANIQSQGVAKMPKGHRKENWSEVVTLLAFVKDAWRNPTMHPKKTYTEKEAFDVFSAVRAFLIRIANIS